MHDEPEYSIRRPRPEPDTLAYAERNRDGTVTLTVAGQTYTLSARLARKLAAQLDDAAGPGGH